MFLFIIDINIYFLTKIKNKNVFLTIKNVNIIKLRLFWMEYNFPYQC